MKTPLAFASLLLSCAPAFAATSAPGGDQVGAIDSLLAIAFLGNTVREYAIALCVFLLVTVLLKFFEKVVVSQLKAFAAKTKTDLDDMLVEILERLGWPFYGTISLYATIQFLAVPASVHSGLDTLALFVGVYYAVVSAQRVIDFFAARSAQTGGDGKAKADSSVLDLMVRLAKYSLWVVAVVLLLQNVGIRVDAIVAGLGVGGIAIAFALQAILTDVFSSFSIYFDKPFKVGDTILVGTDQGVVKKIGIKTTRLQTLQGDELVVPNRLLTETKINNFGKMRERFVMFHFGVTYDTSTPKLKKISEIVKEVVSAVEHAELDRVHFTKFGDSALIYEVRYAVKTNDIYQYLDAQQAINLALKDAFEKEKIEFAFPTQTIYLQKQA